MHERDEGVLALGIDVRRGLVQEVHGGVVQQRPRHGKALALAARQVASRLGHRRVQASGIAHETVQAAAGEGAPQLVVRGSGLRQKQVGANRALEQVAVERHGRDRLAQRGARYVAQVDAAQLHRALVGRVRAGEHAGQRRLARAALARHAHEAAGRRLEVHVSKHRALAVERVAYAAARNADMRRIDRARAVAPLRRVQDGEHPVGGGHAVHGRMEERPQRAQGQEELGRQEHEGERRAEPDRARRVLPQHHDDAHRRAAEGEQVHDGDGVQLHAQKAHGGAAEALGLVVHALVRPPVRLVDLEGGEALDVLEEPAAEIGVRAPVALHDALGDLLDGHDGRRDEGHAREQGHDRRQGQGRQAGEQGERGQHRVEELRQVRAEIALQLLDALHADLHGLPGGGMLAVRRPQAHELVVHLLAHGALGRLACSQAHALRERLACEARGDGQGGGAGQPSGGLGVSRTGHQPLHERSDEQEQRDVGQKADPLEHDVGRDELGGRRHEGEQSLVEHGCPRPLPHRCRAARLPRARLRTDRGRS